MATNGKTTKCPKCKEDIQEGAKKCKHCGADLRNWFVRHKIATGLLIIIVIGTIGRIGNDNTSNNTNTSTSSSNTAQQEEVKEVAIKITARELYAKYEANEIQADDLYKNKLLEVSGVIENIAKDILDNPYVSLKTDNLIGSVQCMLADSEKQKASQLKKGASVTVEGKNDGKLMNVVLRNCKIK